MSLRLLLVMFTCVTSLALASACDSDDDGGRGGNGDADSDTDTDSDGDTDGDSDGDTDVEKQTTAYFIGETLVIGKANLDDSCDVDGDGTADNAIAAMLNAIPKNLLPNDPNETIANKIASGEAISIFELTGVDSFEDDDSLVITAYQGLTDDPEAGSLPDDQFSGHGHINLVEPPNSSLENATISDRVLTTPVGIFSGIVPLGDTLVNVTLERATVELTFNPPPGDDMLNGKATDGKICGAINAQELISLARQSPDVPAILKPVIGTFINPAADLKCDGKQCLSVGLKFTSVSVAVND